MNLERKYFRQQDDIDGGAVRYFLTWDRAMCAIYLTKDGSFGEFDQRFGCMRRVVESFHRCFLLPLLSTPSV